MKLLTDRAALICHKCASVIQSQHQHDYKTCKCGNVSIDGGGAYVRIHFKEAGTYTFCKPEEIGTEWMRAEVAHWKSRASAKGSTDAPR